jgi:membrane protease YdiL (CAAX protease family)
VENLEQDLVCTHHLLDATALFAKLLGNALVGARGLRPNCSISIGTAAVVLFFILAIGEEVGWMGYAVDPMQERWSALTTAIILGVVTGIGHVPSLVQEDFSLTYIAVGLSLSAIGLRILWVWLYNNTGRSLFGAILFHALTNVSSSFISTVAGIPLIAITAVIVTFLWGSRTLAQYRYD